MIKQRLYGAVFLIVPVLLVTLSIAIYQKRFVTADMVTLYTSDAGNEMFPNADVKLHGVVVGQVRSISGEGSRARLRLAIDPGQVRWLPANVSAEMMPTTLFGARYVDLIPPTQPTPARLTAGSVIHENNSRDAIELSRVLNDTLPLLTAIRPDKLAATLTALSQALQDRGIELGRTLVALDGYLKELNPHLPQLNHDITELVQLTRTYDRAVPDILAALNDFTTTSKTVTDRRSDLGSLYSTLTTASQDLDTFLTDNKDNLIHLSTNGLPALRLLAEYSPEFGCTLKTLTEFEPIMDKVLGKGGDQPGLHISLVTVPSRGRYLVNKDEPVYRDRGGPHCYPGPTALGEALAGSVQENELINELSAMTLHQQPAALPDWSGMLVGPVYRGTKVSLR